MITFALLRVTYHIAWGISIQNCIKKNTKEKSNVNAYSRCSFIKKDKMCYLKRTVMIRTLQAGRHGLDVSYCVKTLCVTIFIIMYT